MAVTFTSGAPGALHPLSNDDIVGVVGVKQSGFTANLAHATEYSELVGTGKIAAENSDLADELAAIMDQWGGEVVVSGMPAAPTLGNFKAAVDRLETYEDQPTIYTVAGDWAGKTADADNVALGSLVQTATETVAYLETVCEDTYARAVVWGAQTTIANEKSYAAANAKPRVMPAVNQGSNHNPSGLIVGAALARAAQRGRGWGLDGARVLGATTLQYALTPISADVTELTQTDHASVIVNDGGLYEVAAAEFNTALDTDLERYWEVARQVDHVKRSLTRTARQFISGDFELEELEGKLSQAGNALARARAARRIDVSIDRERSTGAARYFFLRIAPFIAVRSITFETTVVDTYLVI